MAIENFRFQDNEQEELSGVVVTAACKNWPPDTNLLVVAFVYRLNDEHDVYGQFDDRLFVGFLDKSKGEILSAYHDALGQDATLRVGPDSLGIDTARYHLAPGVRAFGLNIRTIAPKPRCAGGWIESFRTLFVREGAKIRPVVEGLIMRRWFFVEENRSCENYESDIAYTSNSIRVGQDSSHGFRNLLITETYKLESGKRPEPPFQYELRYDGQMYLDERFKTRKSP